MTNRPLNFGLSDAISRIGGWSKPDLPVLLDGIQGVIVYGDVSKSVASEVFEARAVTATTRPASFTGIQISSETPGGLVIEEIDAVAGGTGGTPALAVEIATVPTAGNALGKLDCGGIPTLGDPVELTAAVAFSSFLVWTVDFVTGGGASRLSIQNRTRIFVPPGRYFQVFPILFGSFGDVSIHVTWRELADTQGSP